jgi:hypothetical protein
LTKYCSQFSEGYNRKFYATPRFRQYFLMGAIIRISQRAGGLQPGPGAWEGPDLRTFYNFFCWPFSEHFLGCHFTKILLSGHFPRKFRLRHPLTFIFCSYACPVQGGPKSKLLGAREDLNPALNSTKTYSQTILILGCTK